MKSDTQIIRQIMNESFKKPEYMVEGFDAIDRGNHIRISNGREQFHVLKENVGKLAELLKQVEETI